jgi:hypothetical protein
MSSWDKYNGLIRLLQRLAVRYQADATPVTAVSIFRFVQKCHPALLSPTAGVTHFEEV